MATAIENFFMRFVHTSMGTNPQPKRPYQHFPEEEQLFCRVHKENIRPGKVSLLAFRLPDMSVNREKECNAEDARKGHYPEDWGVASILVSDIPPREPIAHVAQIYLLLPRHVPMLGNYAHSEVRVWLKDSEVQRLITDRSDEEFEDDDPDKDDPRCAIHEMDPDFHLRWRKQMARKCKVVVMPKEIAG